MYVDAKKRQARIKEFILLIFLKQHFMITKNKVNTIKAGAFIGLMLILAIKRLMRRFHCKDINDRHVNYIRHSVTVTAHEMLDT